LNREGADIASARFDMVITAIMLILLGAGALLNRA
jgi:hypothetical protein